MSISYLLRMLHVEIGFGSRGHLLSGSPVTQSVSIQSVGRAMMSYWNATVGTDAGTSDNHDSARCCQATGYAGQ